MSTVNIKTSVSKCNESPHAKTLTGLSLVNKGDSDLESDQLKAIKEYVFKHYGPAMRFNQVTTILRMGRSKAYVLKKTDPTFPQGIPLFDSENSPKFYWTHEVIAWLESRNKQFRNHVEGV